MRANSAVTLELASRRFGMDESASWRRLLQCWIGIIPSFPLSVKASCRCVGIGQMRKLENGQSKQQGRGEEIRAELGAAVKGIFDASRNDEIKLPPTMRTRLASLSEIVALARTHVYRNGYGSRDIEHVPEAE